MKARRFYAVLIVFYMLFASHGVFLHATNVQSIKDGNWSDPTVWSSGSVPAASDYIRVKHHVQHGSTLFLDAAGAIIVEVDARLQVADDLRNQGNILNYDSLIVGGVENFGGIENYQTMLVVGGFENRVPGSITNYGKIVLVGDLVNRWKILNEGQVYMTGDLENYGILLASSGHSGYYEVCGSATHHTGATITGLHYLCLKCGGSYTKELGSTGDFLQQCLPFAAVISNLRAEVINDATVSISWSTLSESNSDWFVIERSLSSTGTTCKIGKCGFGREFVEIGRVKGAGNSDNNLDYQFTDTKPATGSNYYRLRMIDTDGVISYSTIVEAMIMGQAMQLLAFPNPNNSVLHIHALGMQGLPATLTLYSIDGKRVWERNLESATGAVRYEIQVCDFASGVYLLKLQQGKQQEVRKLIFEK